MGKKRLTYGLAKYAGLNLLLARWLVHLQEKESLFSYITLGGTELRDVAHLAWIENQLVQFIRSYEEDHERFSLATKTKRVLEETGVMVDLRMEDVFGYRRELPGRHIFYLDFEGVCSLSG